MNKTSKILACLLLSISLVGCASRNKEADVLNVLCPVGAPSLGFVSEYQTITETGKMDFVDGSDPLVANLTKKDSDYHVIVAPINLGCKLIAAKQTDFKLAGVITWGNLYLVGSQDLDQIEEGEIALFGQSAVPELIYNVANVNTKLSPVYYNSATLVQQQLLTQKVEVGMLAEPLATATISKAKQEGIDLKVVADLQELYGEGGYPQAGIFVKEGIDASSLLSKVDVFTNNDYPEMESYLEEIGMDVLKLPSTQIAIASLDRQNVTYKDAHTVKQELTDFLQLFNITFDSSMLQE